MNRFNIDFPILLCVLVLSAVSLIVLFSAGGESVAILRSQFVRILVAIAGMIVLAQVRPEFWEKWAPVIYLGGSVLLLLVILVGDTGKGATRWLDLGFIRFQPSELMKLGVPMMLAWVLARGTIPSGMRELIVSAVVLAVPAALILRQPDLGTTLMILMSGGVIIFLAGFSWRSIALFSTLGTIAAPFFWFGLHDYQRRRITTLFDPWSDPLGSGYHTIQSMIAIGSGGAQGKGWLQGSQSQLEFIPERHTDFIFSVLAEEFGFIGVVLLVIVYLILCARGLYIAYTSSDNFSRLLAGSISMTFFFYVFVNIGMVAGMLPVVGVPLPLISFGGTSIVTLMASLGILMAISSKRTFVARAR